MDKLINVMILALIGCVLVIMGLIGLFLAPQKEPKSMTIYECLETMGDYTLCERKIINGRQ